VLDGCGDRRKGKGSFRGKHGAFHRNRWRLCCVVVRERRTLPELLWGGLVFYFQWTAKLAVDMRTLYGPLDYARTSPVPFRSVQFS